MYDAAAKKHAAAVRAEERSEAATLFKPKIQKSTGDILKHARPELLLEGPEERARRMSDDEMRRIEARKQELENVVYNENDYSFAPNIDRVSKALGRDSSIDELYENRRGQRIKTNLIRKVNEDIAKECSFAPQTNHKNSAFGLEVSATGARAVPIWESCAVAEEDEMARRKLVNNGNRPLSAPSAGMRINLREPERMARDIRHHLAEKEEKRREIMAVREINELSECTFQPALPHYKASSFNTPVVVRGIARHLELKNLSDKIRKEKEDRIKNAYKVKNINKIKRSGDGTTIIEVKYSHDSIMFLVVNIIIIILICVGIFFKRTFSQNK